MGSVAKSSICFGLAALFLMIWTLYMERPVAVAQARKPYRIVRLFTGPDGLTHAEETEASANPNGVVHLMAVTGAEIHRSAPGSVMSWHTEARRQYVITLSGHGEIEVAGGEKIAIGPGSIELVEDATGKGHISRVIGSEERVSLWLPLTDQAR
jgi:hypothetical protein